MANGNLYLSVDGKTIGIRFGFHALMGMTGDQVFGDGSVTTQSQQSFVNAVTVTKMAWLGYQTHCLYMEQIPEMNFQQFFDFMEDVYVDKPETIGEIWRLFSESNDRGKKLQVDEKKSLTKKQSTTKKSMDTP